MMKSCRWSWHVSAWSKQKVGALIVIEHNFPLDDVVRTGEVINADINQRLIENIFSRTALCMMVQ